MIGMARKTVEGDPQVVVIGAGHNGLVAATYLARAGMKVLVVERKNHTGGAALTEAVWPGYLFSTCAHLLHGVPPKLFKDFNLSAHGVDIVPREEPIVLTPDGSYYGPRNHESPRNHWGPDQLTAAEREQESNYLAFKSRLAGLFAPYRLGPFPSREAFLQSLSSEDQNFVEKVCRQTVREIQHACLPSARIRGGYALDGAAVARDPIALSLAYSSLTEPYPGEGPPQHGFVRGGMGELSNALEKEARLAGVEFVFGHRVEKIQVEAGRTVGVRLDDGSEIAASLILSNLDPKQTFLRLIDESVIEPDFTARIGQLKTQVSCLKLLAVISDLPDWQSWDGDPAHPHSGSVFLNANRESLDACYDDIAAGRPPRRPVMSVNLPSYNDRSLAQGDHQTASVWIFPAGYSLNDQSWDDCREAVAEDLVDQIDACAPNFRKSIIHYKLRTPLDIERENAMTDGCIWHVQHNAESMFWNRPLPELRNYTSPISGLYLCGCGQHPGGEVTGIPGHNVAQLILQG